MLRLAQEASGDNLTAVRRLLTEADEDGSEPLHFSVLGGHVAVALAQDRSAHVAVSGLEEDEGRVLTGQQRVAGEHECRPLDGQAVGVERGGGGIGRAQDSERVDVAGGGAHKVLA